MKKETKSIGVEFLAAIFTVMAGLLTVIYTGGSFGGWDLLVGAFVIYVCYSHRISLSASREIFMISRVGLSIAIMIAGLSILTAISETMVKSVLEWQVSIFHSTIFFAAGIFGISFLFYRR